MRRIDALRVTFDFMVCFVVFRNLIGCPFLRIKCLSYLLSLPSQGAAAAVPGNVPEAALPAFNNNIQPAAHVGRGVATPDRRVARLPVQRPVVNPVTPGTTPHRVGNVYPHTYLQPGDVISVNGIEDETFVVTDTYLVNGVEWVFYLDRGYVFNKLWAHVFTEQT